MRRDRHEFGPPWGPPRHVARFPLVAVTLVIQVVGTFGAARTHPGATDLDAFAVFLVVIGPLSLAFLSRSPQAVLSVTTVATVAYLALGHPYGPVFLALVIAVIACIVNGRRAAAWLAMAVTIAVGLGARVGWLDEPWSWSLAIGVIAWALVVAVFGELLRVRRAGIVEARRTRAEVARRQAGEERLRIARELHDVVAHHMSLINVQAGVALHLVDRQPEQVEIALATIKDASKEALTELRALIGVLREEGEGAPRAPVATLASLDDLVARTRQAGVILTTDVTGDTSRLPAAVEMATFRIIQEAVTNIVRHSGATSATIDVTVGADAVAIDVRDDGRGLNHGPVDGDDAGTGLRGMQERAYALGGTVVVDSPVGGGTHVRAHLPLGPA